MTNPATQPDGLHLLIGWANDQDHWVRAIVGEVVSTRKEMPEKSIAATYAMMLAEKGLSADPSPAVPLLGFGELPQEAIDDLRLIGLRDLSGVNALASGQRIEFSPRLTVLFGENASGKTGYVRVLKRAASVRSAEPVLGNVYAAAAGKPHATVDYSLAGKPMSLEWNDETGLPPFTRMSVFDSRAVSLHLDDDLTYVFTPGELALFRYTHKAVAAVKDRLEREKTEADRRSNPFLLRFQRESEVYPKVETLGASTNLADIERLATIKPEEESQVQALKDRVGALQPQSVDARLRVASSDRDLFNKFHVAARAAASFSWDEYTAATAGVRQARERYDAVSKTAFSGIDIPGLFGQAWRNFIEAGEAYHQETGGHGDHDGDACPYCRTTLDGRALELLRKYSDYCRNEPKRALDAANEAVRRLTSTLATVAPVDLKAAMDSRSGGLSDATVMSPIFLKAPPFLSELVVAQAAISRGEPFDGVTLRNIATECEAGFAVAVQQTDTLITSLRKQVDERRVELERETARLRLLENRLVLRTLLPDIRKHVESAQWAGRAGTLLTSRLPSVMRSLTDQTKIASEQLLDQDFERLFDAECEALRAPKVQLDFVGRRGEAARKKKVVDGHRLSEILSEGEQKVIALADFLAEASLRRTAAPVVFDDPVNSLDHRRLKEVATRIVQLSMQRQVVLFTHNILLVMELVSHFENDPSDFAYFSVEEIDGQIGVVTSGAQPRLDSLGDLRAKINRIIQDAGTQAGVTRAALIEKAYEIMRAWIEIFVEQELLAKVAQRYSPHVAVTCLDNIKADRFPAAVAVIRPIYDAICRYIASHSQPRETLGIRPTLDNLREDWKRAQEAREVYRKE
jgi:hypothetical protein